MHLSPQAFGIQEILVAIFITKYVHSNIQLVIQQTLIKCPLCISHYISYWDANMSMADRISLPLEISMCCTVWHIVNAQ